MEVMSRPRHLTDERAWQSGGKGRGWTFDLLTRRNPEGRRQGGVMTEEYRPNHAKDPGPVRFYTGVKSLMQNAFY